MRALEDQPYHQSPNATLIIMILKISMDRKSELKKKKKKKGREKKRGVI